MAKKISKPTKRSTPQPAAPSVKPVKEVLSKTDLTRHLAETSGVEPKAVKAVLAALETTVRGAVHKKGAGQFTLPGLFKVTVLAVPAKKKRFGKDPFTGEERWFAAKPATVKVKVRTLKKLKDSAL